MYDNILSYWQFKNYNSIKNIVFLELLNKNICSVETYTYVPIFTV
jgi:hypothetical protein